MNERSDLMESKKMTIKELGVVFSSGQITDELLEMCRSDSRKSVQSILRRYERQQAERERVAKLYAYEEQALAEGFRIVAGVDEAGRGPLAGPVSIAAVVLPHNLYLPRINDSKKLSPNVRDELFDEIQEKAISIGTALVDAAVIDRLNIYQATINGMYEAIFSLNPQPDKVLIDAVRLEQLPMKSLSIIKGDAKSASIAAASIIAKVTRDRLMDEYDREYPQYGFARHKGYGTAEHIDAIRKYGPCPIHRKSFEPIKSIIENQL